MQFTVFDLETTGLNPSSAAVVQFAYITVNQNMLPIRGRNYYLYKEGMPWSEEAEAVHGLSQDFLRRYADQYDANLIHMYQVLQRANLIGHNSDGFDIPFASQFLAREGMPVLTPGFCFDTMKIWQGPFKKKMKLAALPGELGIPEESIITLAKLLFKDTAGDLRAHNSCYDVAATLCCMREALRQGLVSVAPRVAAPKTSAFYD